MKETRHEPPLSAEDLALRWGLSKEQVYRRIKQLGIPGFNVGTARQPEWRFRLATVEQWEAQHEQDIQEPGGAGGGPAHLIPGAPPSWDGKSRLKGRLPLLPKR